MPLLGTRGAAASKGFGLTAFAPKPYAASYLVIAGGGGGSGASSYMLGGGGGGAGGYRNSYASENSGGGGSTETPLQLTQAKLILLQSEAAVLVLPVKVLVKLLVAQMEMIHQ